MKAVLKKGEHVISPRYLRLARDAGEDPVVRASALLVALSMSDEQAQVFAALARKSTAKNTQKYQAQVEALWEKANKESLAFLNLILSNNPAKTPAQILARPDIQEALRQPYEEAAEKSEDLLRKAWAESEADAVKKVKGEFKQTKEDWKGHEADSDLLDAVVLDLHKNAKAMRSRYSAALKEPGEKGLAYRLKMITQDAKRRAGYSLTTVTWGAVTSTRDSAFQKAGLNKMWVSRDWPNRCSHCKALHGTVVGPGEQFPHAHPGLPVLGVYGGALFGPPRHPNCQCVVVGTKLKKN